MSYETNPTFNRLKINKGWKNPTFPIKVSNYSGEMLLWFKVYLLLKVYLSLYQIKLLTCELRVSEYHTKILYLSVTKQSSKKTFIKSKWKSKSFLRDLKSPLTKLEKKKARFLLYLDLKRLKQNSSLIFNSWQKKILSKAWISKPRLSSWINFSNMVIRFRKQAFWRQNFFQKQKDFYEKEKKQSDSFNKKKEVNLQLFWTKKKNKIQSLWTKTQKELFFLEKSLYLLVQMVSTHKTASIYILIHNLILKSKKKQHALDKLQTLYDFWLQIEEEVCEEVKISLFQKQLQSQKKKAQFKRYWFLLKKQLLFLKKQYLFLRNQPQAIMLLQSNVFRKTLQHCFLVPMSKKRISALFQLYVLYNNKIQHLEQKTTDFTKKLKCVPSWTDKNTSSLLVKKVESQNNLKDLTKESTPRSFQILAKNQDLRNKRRKKATKHTLLTTTWNTNTPFLAQIRFLEKQRKLVSLQVTKLLRFKQKTNLKVLQFPKSFSKTKGKKNVTRKAKLRKKSLIYRLASKHNYKQQLQLKTNFHVKYLIQDLIQQYFKTQLCVKLLWPLTQFKNLKFYRVVFPAYKFKGPKKRALNSLTNISPYKRYFFVGLATKHLHLNIKMQPFKKKHFFQKKVNSITSTLSSNKLLSNIKSFSQKSPLQLIADEYIIKTKKIQFQNWQMRNNFVIPFKKTNWQKNIISQFWKKKHLKKNAHSVRKLKVIQAKNANRVYWASKESFISDLITTITLFSKYLDPQPLAEHLAKIIGTTRNHASTLKLVEKVLQTKRMKRGFGYRIALIGRINGATKSRTLYLRKLKQNRSRQTFSKNVKFAMAHARATIGSFNIKVWVYLA